MATRQRLQPTRGGLTHKVQIYDEVMGGTQEGYIIANVDNGQVREVFLHGFGKQGSTLDGWTQVTATFLSIVLQYGADLETVCHKLRLTNFPPQGRTDNPRIPHCRSVPDYIGHWLALTFGDSQLKLAMEALDKELEQA